VKPKPWPGKFASEAEEQEHVLDCLCWFFAQDMSLSLGMSQEECADYLKQDIHDGRLVIEHDKKRRRMRIVPVASTEDH